MGDSKCRSTATHEKSPSVFAIIPNQPITRDLNNHWNLKIRYSAPSWRHSLAAWCALSCLICHKLQAQKYLVLSNKNRLVSRCVSALSKQNWPPQMHEAVCLSKARSALRWCLPWQLACTQQASTTGGWWPCRCKRCGLHLHIVLVLWMTFVGDTLTHFHPIRWFTSRTNFVVAHVCSFAYMLYITTTSLSSSQI